MSGAGEDAKVVEGGSGPRKEGEEGVAKPVSLERLDRLSLEMNPPKDRYEYFGGRFIFKNFAVDSAEPPSI